MINSIIGGNCFHKVYALIVGIINDKIKVGSNAIKFVSKSVHSKTESDGTISPIIYPYFIPAFHVFIKIIILICTIQRGRGVITQFIFFYPLILCKLIISQRRNSIISGREVPILFI